MSLSSNATFTSLSEATAEDWRILAEPSNVQSEHASVARNMLNLLAAQKDGPSHGWPINNYAHCLQTATRAMQAGEDDEIILCALFHDATEAINVDDHGGLAAMLLKPYVSADNVWLVQHHAVFQDYYCRNNPQRFSNDREAFRGHPMFERTVTFCERYDQNSFDPHFENYELSVFEPIVHRLLQSPRAA